MGWAPLAIAVLTAALIPQLVASSPIESVQPNSTLDVLRECRHDSTAVHCDLKDWPNRQVTLSAKSLPEHTRRVTIENVKELVIEANAITSLAHLEVIQLHNIGTLTLLTRSLARDRETGPMDLLINDVQNLEVHKETFSKWRNQSKVHISGVENCQLLDMAFASTHLRSLSIQKVTSLDIKQGAFSAASSIDNMRMTEIESLSISTGAVTSNVTLKTMKMADIDALSLQPGAFAHGSTIHEVNIKRVPNLHIASGGINSIIDNVKLSEVSMEACEGHTFGSSMKSLAMVSSHINRTKTNCISAVKTKLLLEACQIDLVEPLAIHGAIELVEIRSSDFGIIDREGLRVNVAKLSVEESAFDKVSDRALAVHATEQIDFKDCNINILQNNAFDLLRMKADAQEQIILDNLKIKTPEEGSLRFTRRQNILIQQLEIGIPCNCPMADVATALGLGDEEHGNNDGIRRLPLQISCEHNGSWPTLAEYQLQFCPDLPAAPSTTTALPTTSVLATTISMPREDRPTLQPQSSAGDSPEQGPQRASHTMHQHGDSPDQVQTGSSHNLILILTTTCAVLIVLVVIALFARRHFGHLPRHPSTPGRNFWRRIFTRDQQTSGSSQPLTISAPILGVTGPACSTPHQASVQSVTDSQASTGPTESHTSRGTVQGTDSPGIHLLSLEAQGGAHGGSWQEPRYYVDIPVDIRPPSQRLVRPRPARTHRSGGGARESSRARSERRDWESYQMNRQKDPRIQQLARDPRWARGEILLDPEF
ncbi:uncharacterized protein LOC122365368 [Amphibalanus amphitrite]|uniref:uncharacterized protein LOC122365368 n=1 Tax=Amphibalanus amphitrite TaxID=1232801 RepID=UPI001C903E53|nr:uncharacterized protein LOC122365368 [Amphibalanus amphitrite]